VFGVSGTAVQEGITFGPYSINFDGYRFGGAGGWALLESGDNALGSLVYAFAASPTHITKLHPLWMVDPRYVTFLGAGGVRRRLRRVLPPSAVTRNRYRQPDRA
jgi:hypothetical protein